MNNIFKFFIERPKLVNMVLILVFVMGMLSFVNLKRNALPNVDFKMMFVTTIYPGASPKDVEVNVTIPLEEQIQKVSGIKQMNSYSSENFSNVFVELDPNVKDLDKVKDDVVKAVERVSGLPAEIKEKPIITELKSDIFPVFEISLRGNYSVSELELRKYAKTLEKDISLLPGVGGTDLIGYRKREVQIDVDLAKASRNYISLSEVMGAIRAANVRMSGGDIDVAAGKKKIVTLTEFEDPLEVKDVIVRSAFSGRRILVSDIAQVRDGFEKEYKITKTNGEPCINIVVSKKEDADAVRVAGRVKKLVGEFNKTLPKGIQAQVVRDFSRFVNAMLNVVVQNALIGFVLVLLCLMIFLHPRVAFWTALGIPFSLFATFYFMPIYNISVTSISLLAIVIVLGMLVDDAIVVAEHIFSFREKGMNPIEASVRGVSAIFWPVVATVSTTIAAFIPILMMGGIMGEWLRAIPIMVTVVLTASLIESAFILPAHLAHTKIKAKEKPWLIRILEGSYRRNLMRVLRRKYLVILFFIAVFIFSVTVVFPRIGFRLHPDVDNNLIQIRMETPKGTPVAETERRVAMVEKVINETIPKEVLSSFVTTIGEKGTEIWESATAVSQSHWARVIIYLIPREDRKITVWQLREELDKNLKGIKASDFTQLDVISRLGGPPVGQPIDVTFIGNDDRIRRQLADELYNLISTNEAIFSITRSDERGLKEINVKVNTGLMSELGITASDVGQVVRAAVDGNVVTSIRKRGEEIDFRVSVADKNRGTPEFIRNLTIPNRMGKLIRLGAFVKFDEKSSSLAIWHREGDRSVSIRAEMDTDKLNAGEYNKILRARFAPMVAKYPEFRVKFGGLELSTEESMSDFYNALIIALAVIYIILVVLFNSFTQPIIVMLAIPFGLIGVIFAFFIHMTTITFLGLIGILGLAGVVVNNSLVMLKFLNEKQRTECTVGEMLKLEHVVDGAAARFRPVVLTTLTTVAGLLPSLYGFIGGRIPELFPLLLAIAWGLVFASFITLFLIPAIYLVERDFSSWFYNKFRKKTVAE
jgi:multidrug efflux pump subunit AcrB